MWIYICLVFLLCYVFEFSHFDQMKNASLSASVMLQLEWRWVHNTYHICLHHGRGMHCCVAGLSSRHSQTFLIKSQRPNHIILILRSCPQFHFSSHRWTPIIAKVFRWVLSNLAGMKGHLRTCFSLNYQITLEDVFHRYMDVFNSLL